MSDGMKAMIPLLDEGESGFLEMKAAVGESGAAGEVAGARMGGFKGSLETLKGAWESLLIGTVMPWLDTMGGVATQISGAVDWFNGLSPAVKNAGAGTGLIGEWLKIMGYPAVEALDISPCMLELAMAKRCYSAFHAQAALSQVLIPVLGLRYFNAVKPAKNHER